MTTLDVPLIIAAPANRDSSQRPASSPRSGRSARPLAGRQGVLVACVLVIAVGTAALLWRVHPHSTVTFVTAPVTRGAVAPFVTASGTVNPVVIVQVGTYVSGVIQELRCDFNTRVTRNQLCAKIDPRPYQTVVDQDRANVDQARAQLEKDQSNLQFAKLTFDRDSELIALDSVSKQDLDTAESAYREAVSQIAVDRAVRSAGGGPQVLSGQSRLYGYCVSRRGHRGLAERHAGTDRRRELPNPDIVCHRD